MVAAAAATERPEALDAVLAAGGTITLDDVKQLVKEQGWTAPRGLALLLSRGAPPVPADVPPGMVVPWKACPVYSLLESFYKEQDGVSCAAQHALCTAAWRVHGS